MTLNHKFTLKLSQKKEENFTNMVMKGNELRLTLGYSVLALMPNMYKREEIMEPWQTLCKIFSKCLTTRVTGWDQPPLQIMQMLYCFVNNIHVDYAELMWEGIYYSLHHPATSIPYPRFTKIIISHYMTIFPDISRRARDAYHNLQDDDIMKNIFNSGRNKNKVGMRIPAWMITDEMKLTEHYKMYAEVFGLDVPMTQSQPTESTQGTHRTLSAPRQSARLTPPVPVPTAEKADEMILQDMIQAPSLEHSEWKEGTEVEIVQEKDEETSKDTDEKRFMHGNPSDQHSLIHLHDVHDGNAPSLVKGKRVTEHVKKEGSCAKRQVRDQVPVYGSKRLDYGKERLKKSLRLIS
ncbi:hypothetical protein Tco_0740563 [Tanacetum coccineum]